MRRSNLPCPPLAVVALTFVAALLSVARARAADAEAELPSFGLLLRDEEPLPEAPPPRAAAPLWIALGASAQRDPERTSFGGLLLVGLPLDRLWERRRGPAVSAAIAETPRLKPAPAGDRPSDASPPPASRPPRPIPLLVAPTAARAAVRAALREARLVAPDADLDALASRARSASLLPELRLRAMRLVDEDESLAPTEYDPARTTASGGTSLWLEARATWRLDRLVFADDEVAIERLRGERAAAQRKLAERVLEALAAWQRALARGADDARSPEERRDDALEVASRAAELDVLTGGWFSGMLEKRENR
jgi:hypothetical protein